MLLELEVENFALVKSLRLSFEHGLTVLTGETGAGKSIILDSLGFLLGGSAREACSGPGRVAGRFLLNPSARGLLEEWGFPPEGDEVLLEREVKSSGRSSARLNTRMATLGSLKELGSLLLDLHGQHQSHSLQRPSRHQELLDELAGHRQQLEEYAGTYRMEQRLQTELAVLREAERERIREIEWLFHEVEQIRAAAPVVGEEQELDAAVRRLSAAEELTGTTQRAAEALSGERGCLDLLAEAQKGVAAVVRHDQALEGVTGRLAEAEILLSEVSRELCSYADALSRDPDLLDELQGRLELLKDLRRKFGPTLEEVLAYAETGEQRLRELQGAEERGERLEHQLDEERARLRELAGLLGDRRRQAARRLEQEVRGELAGLGMEHAVFEVALEPLERLSAAGAERVEFLLSPNPGNPPKPLARVASGGELSRVMLGLIAVFSRYDPVPTLVFDEIDVGLGGRAAEAVARKLRELAERSQVLCVTHQAMVAACAHHHLRVHKQVVGQNTHIGVDRLEDAAREQEIARMLSGDASPRAAQHHAQELLAAAGGPAAPLQG